MSTITRGTKATPWHYRSLIWNFSRRDLKARFRGTLFGWLWSLMLPLATVLIYSAVFSVIFRAAPPDFGSGRTGNYAVWLLVGLVTYSFFATGVNLSIPTLLGAGRMLQKIYMPSYVPVIGASIATSLQSLIELGILAVILIALGNLGLSWLFLPVILVLYFIFVTSVSLILSILNVYARDLQQITAVVVQLLFFLSPILYPLDRIPDEWHGIPVKVVMALNPIAEFVTAIRSVLYDLTLPSVGIMLGITGWTAFAVLLAWWVYIRKGQDIGEAV